MRRIRNDGYYAMTQKGKDRPTLVAVYPGTFDPIHNGHVDVIRRSVAVFDEVIVAVTYNPHKDAALFSADERVEMIREVIHDLEPRARVDKFSGLSVDYAERIGARVIIRSLRAVTDFDYELQMAQMNKAMQPNLETVFMFSNPRLFFTASRLIKEVASHGKRVPELVPELVMNRLRAKLKVT
jgi:pantetheine-phosphate adenylyltransferase